MHTDLGIQRAFKYLDGIFFFLSTSPTHTSEKMSKLTLESLPSDIIVEALHRFSSYEDLFKIIASSPVWYKLFRAFSNQILTSVAKNIFGDSWQEATALLVYLRHTDSSLTSLGGLSTNVEPEFVLRRTDIALILTAQQVFDCCAVDFATFFSPQCLAPQVLDQGNILQMMAQGLGTSTLHAALPVSGVNTSGGVPGTTAPDPNTLTTEPTPSFTILPMKLFYKTWVMSYRYKFENLITFGHREPLSAQEYTDIFFVSRVLFRYRTFPGSMRCRWNNGLVWAFPRPATSWDGKEPTDIVYRNNPLILAKMMINLSWTHHVSTAQGDFLSYASDFLADYRNMSFDAVVAKYGIASGREIWDWQRRVLGPGYLQRVMSGWGRF